ncbi:MAG: pyridoxine 5'-phosphate synthase [Calditrichaeota bacterium]|nr:pyridoxine 5'-phosphate synthase [Calditrichota bacterium]
MTRFGINLNPFVLFINQFKIRSFTAQHLALTAELEQVDALSLFYDQSEEMIALDSLKHLSNSACRFLNVQTSIGNDYFRDLIDVKPNMISFTGPFNSSNFKCEASDITEQDEFINDAVHTIKSNEIMAAILIEPDIKLVKQIAKFPFDYVEFDLTKLNTAHDLNHELEELENLKMAVLAAEKYGMGIQASGYVNSDNIEHLNQFPQIEEVYSGRHLFERSLVIGFRSVIAEYRSLFKSHHVELKA